MVTEEFERDLRRFMRETGITEQSAAIRQALREAGSKPVLHPSATTALG